MADPGVVLGFPYQQLNSESGRFGYEGLSPEDAIQQQRLNRRQQIANLLIQRGLAQPQGTMAGRFFVAPSPLQNVANLATLGAGLYGSQQIGEQEKDLAKQGNERRAQAVQDYVRKISPQPETVEAAGPGAPVQKDSLDAYPFLQTLSPQEIHQGRWQREVDERGPGAFQEGPTPKTTIMREPTAEAKRIALIEAMTNSDPRIRESIKLVEGLRQQEEEKATQRAFLTQEKALDREVRREGIQSTALMRAEQMKNTLTLTQMQIDAREQQGRDATELKKLLAEQQANLQKELRALDAESRKEAARIAAESRKDAAQISAQSHLDVAKMQIEGKKELQQSKPMPASAVKQQQEELELLGSLSGINADLKAAKRQIDDGALQLGPMQNLTSRGKNYLGMSDEASRNYASFKATMEKQRNASLLLNKGVQTEGDAQRAWNELFENMNDPKVVSQRLDEIQRLNERAAGIRKLNVDTLRKNWSQEPFDFSGYEQQPAAIGAPTAPAAGGTVAPFADAEKERRYQEWKKSQGQ